MTPKFSYTQETFVWGRHFATQSSRLPTKRDIENEVNRLDSNEDDDDYDDEEGEDENPSDDAPISIREIQAAIDKELASVIEQSHMQTRLTNKFDVDIYNGLLVARRRATSDQEDEVVLRMLLPSSEEISAREQEIQFKEQQDELRISLLARRRQQAKEEREARRLAREQERKKKLTKQQLRELEDQEAQEELDEEDEAEDNMFRRSFGLIPIEVEVKKPSGKKAVIKAEIRSDGQDLLFDHVVIGDGLSVHFGTVSPSLGEDLSNYFMKTLELDEELVGDLKILVVNNIMKKQIVGLEKLKQFFQ